MITLLIAAVCLCSLFAGLAFGFRLGAIAERNSREALDDKRYQGAIGVMSDLVNTPDALDLRPRAQRILAAHMAAKHHQG